jgi:hypothetical protein
MTRRLVAAAILVTWAGLAQAGMPARPSPGDGSNFYLSMGIESATFDLDPRGSTDFVAAGLDPRGDPQPQVFVGVGWVFARPLRLGLTAGGGEVEVDRPGIDCVIGRALITMHLSVAESRRAVLELDFSLGSHALVYSGLPDEEAIFGAETGLGVSGRLRLSGAIGVSCGYRYHLTRHERTTIDLSDDEQVSLHPTGRSYGWRVALIWDL